MSVPLDRLYYFLHDLCNHDVIIYHFYPHGSKKPESIKPLFPDMEASYFSVPVLCHDQEPLQFEEWLAVPDAFKIPGHPHSKFKLWINRFNTFDKLILVHSELNSADVEKFKKDGAVPVYYWSHAIIANDWFRYAKHDQRLNHKDIKNRFLIYNRAWQGSREYRLKFADLLVDRGLLHNCQTSFSPMDNDKHYTDHQFVNSSFVPNNTNLEDYFSENLTPSWASADYTVEDYQQTEIEVVLETLFDDTRWHLTEKTLRAIAVGQPFILCATPGSLQYLRSYGFETFDQCWDESYDKIQNPIQRLNAIVDLMSDIQDSDIALAKQIAKKNQEHFFSGAFKKRVIDEFSTNINSAIAEVRQSQSCAYFLRYYNLASGFRKSVPEHILQEIKKLAENTNR